MTDARTTTRSPNSSVRGLWRKLGDGVFPPFRSHARPKPNTTSPVASPHAQAAVRRMLKAHLCDFGDDESDSDSESQRPPAPPMQQKPKHERFVVHYRQAPPAPPPVQAAQGTLYGIVESPDELGRAYGPGRVDRRGGWPAQKMSKGSAGPGFVMVA